MKKKEIQLISTDFSPKIFKNRNLFFLGPWCNTNIKNYHQLQSFIWLKKATLEKDYNYINKLLKRLAEKIPTYLNKFHNKKYPETFWRSLLWVWLSLYLGSNYFKWKTFREAIKKNSNSKIRFVQINFDSLICPKDTHSFKNFTQESDIFNEYTFSKISNYFAKNIKISKQKKNFKFNFYEKFQYNLKQKTFVILKKISNFISIKIFQSRSIIYQGFKLKNLINLSLKKFTLPIFINEYFPVNNIELKILSKEQIIKRKKNILDFKTKNDFERYILEALPTEIPMSFLEDFPEMIMRAESIKIKSNTMFSSIGHYFNDKYKVWLFYKKILKKNKLIIIEHGGNHSKGRHSIFFNYDNFVGDVFIPWDKSVNLPAEKFIGFNLKKKETKNLLYIGFETDKYPSKIVDEISTLNELENIPNLNHLKKKLDKKIFDKLVYVQKKNREKRVIQKIKKIIGVKKLKKKGTFMKELSKAKLAICDYPQTTYFESLLTCPTILVININKSWKPLKRYLKFYSDLEKNKMLFKDIKNATQFVNKNWDNINEWWESKKIINLRKKLLREFNIDTRKESINKWGEYVKAIDRNNAI